VHSLFLRSAEATFPEADVEDAILVFFFGCDVARFSYDIQSFPILAEPHF
jgi:hypothetical protein